MPKFRTRSNKNFSYGRQLQFAGRNALKTHMALVRRHSAPVLQKYGIKNRHELRAAYACDRYRKITGQPAPVIAGGRRNSKEEDLKAREIIARELGHNRPDVLSAYIGSSRARPSSQINKSPAAGEPPCLPMPN